MNRQNDAVLLEEIIKRFHCCDALLCAVHSEVLGFCPSEYEVDKALWGAITFMRETLNILESAVTPTKKHSL